MTGEIVAAFLRQRSNREYSSDITKPCISQRLRSRVYYYAGSIISLFFVWTVNLAFLLFNLLYNHSGRRKLFSLLVCHAISPLRSRPKGLCSCLIRRTETFTTAYESSSLNGVNHASVGGLSSQQMLVRILICVIGAK